MLWDNSSYMIQAYSLWGSHYEVEIHKLTRNEPMTCCIYNATTDGFGEKCISENQKCISEIFENFDQ